MFIAIHINLYISTNTMTPESKISRCVYTIEDLKRKLIPFLYIFLYQKLKNDLKNRI